MHAGRRAPVLSLGRVQRRGLFAHGLLQRFHARDGASSAGPLNTRIFVSESKAMGRILASTRLFALAALVAGAAPMAFAADKATDKAAAKADAGDDDDFSKEESALRSTDRTDVREVYISAL